jgi:HD-GYP domain-containing protein (c-di-GMP phosphodiesterase class II)
LMDLQADEILDFDTAIYLPANDKYIRFTSAGDPLDSDRIDRLKKHGFRSVHVPVDQMKQYYSYAAKRLKDVSSIEQRTACVRELLGGVIVELDREATFAEGRAVMTQASEIISSYVQKTSSSSCYQRILELSDEGADAYAHAANVSTIAALIALGTGRAKPEHLALAGLLHDSGAPLVGEDFETRDYESLDERDKQLFEAHIPATLELIRQRKILLPQEVTRAILEHHERYDGRGFPERKAGAKISVEAQILAIADAIDRWSAVVPGRSRRPMLDWVYAQRERLARGDRPGEFDPELLAAALALFP